MNFIHLPTLETNINLSNNIADHELFWHEDFLAKGMKITAFVVLLGISLIGNLLLIAVVYKNSNHRMRPPSNYLVINMACVDILFTVYCIPQYIALTANDSQWLMGGVAEELFCRLFIFVAYMSVLMSTETLFIIALDRFLLLFFPLKKFITLQIACRIIIVIWTAGIIFTLPLYKIASLTTLYDRFLFCHTDISAAESIFVYFVIHFFAFFPTPILATIILYAAIAIKLKKTKLPGDQFPSNQDKRERMNCKLLTMLVLIVAMLVLCRFSWLIGAVVCYQNAYSVCSSPQIIFTAWFFTLANIAINPWIYFIFNEQFRHIAKELLRRIMPCCIVSAYKVKTEQSIVMAEKQLALEHNNKIHKSNCERKL